MQLEKPLFEMLFVRCGKTRIGDASAWVDFKLGREALSPRKVRARLDRHACILCNTDPAKQRSHGLSINPEGT